MQAKSVAFFSFCELLQVVVGVLLLRLRYVLVVCLHPCMQSKSVTFFSFCELLQVVVGVLLLRLRYVSLSVCCFFLLRQEGSYDGC